MVDDDDDDDDDGDDNNISAMRAACPFYYSPWTDLPKNVVSIKHSVAPNTQLFSGLPLSPLTCVLNLYSYFFFRCAAHFGIYTDHTPTNAVFIKLDNVLKCTLNQTPLSPTCCGLRPSSRSLH